MVPVPIWGTGALTKKSINTGGSGCPIEDVERAEQERRSDFRRILQTDDYGILEEVYKNNDIRGIEQIGHLLHNLSVLEYENDENWCDIHPTLKNVLDV